MWERIGVFGIRMETQNMSRRLNIEFGRAICYSGYRDGQNPRTETFPSYEEVKEDLLILSSNWKYLRLYDCSRHADLVLDVIHKEALDFKLMLGVDMAAEVSNHQCPWGADFDDETLAANAQKNSAEVDRLIVLANQYPDTIFSVSVGNEASVEWTDHMVPVENLIAYVRRIKQSVQQPVTFCENYLPWLDKLRDLVEEVDFISIHTYPVWEYKSIQEGLSYTIDNYNAVAQAYPDVQIVITEAGWATASNGHGIDVDKVNEVYQKQYFQQLMDWAEQQQVLVYYFEAFDENWKGSCDPFEPEKHWGLYKADRTPKLAMNNNI